MQSNKDKHIFNNYYFLCNNRSERILEWNIIDNNILCNLLRVLLTRH